MFNIVIIANIVNVVNMLNIVNILPIQLDPYSQLLAHPLIRHTKSLCCAILHVFLF